MRSVAGCEEEHRCTSHLNFCQGVLPQLFATRFHQVSKFINLKDLSVFGLSDIGRFPV